MIFLYCHDGYWADACFITPDDGGPLIQHQYNCVLCSQMGERNATRLRNIALVKCKSRSRPPSEQRAKLAALRRRQTESLFVGNR